MDTGNGPLKGSCLQPFERPVGPGGLPPDGRRLGHSIAIRAGAPVDQSSRWAGLPRQRRRDARLKRRGGSPGDGSRLTAHCRLARGFFRSGLECGLAGLASAWPRQLPGSGNQPAGPPQHATGGVCSGLWSRCPTFGQRSLERCGQGSWGWLRPGYSLDFRRTGSIDLQSSPVLRVERHWPWLLTTLMPASIHQLAGG